MSDKNSPHKGVAGRRRLRILLVEDDRIDRMAIERWIKQERLPYDLVPAGTVAEAIAYLQQGGMDLALIDFNLPDGFGLDVQAQMGKTPCVFIAGSPKEAGVIQAMKAGAYDFLIKDLNRDYLELLPGVIEATLERAKVEAQLELQQHIINSVREIVLLLDERGEVIFANRAVEQVLGYTRAEILGEGWWRLIFSPAEDRRRAKSRLVARVRGEEPLAQYDLKLPCKDGREIWTAWVESRGPMDRLICMGHDITERKRAEDALQQAHDELERRVAARTAELFTANEILRAEIAERKRAWIERDRLAVTSRRLVTAIEQTAESIIITDIDGSILYVNPAFERITGYGRVEVIGRQPSLLQSGQQEWALYEKLWATISAGQVWQGRFVNKRKDGTLYTVDTTITPVRDENQQIVNYIGLQHDVSRELELEQQYRQSQKIEAIGRLTAGIAHDFNNLLTAINGFAELLRMQLPADDPHQELVEKILHPGRRAADLVRQLLTFSRVQIIEPKVINLNATVADMERMLRRVIGENIEMETNLAPELWLTRADPVQVEQVIVNLAVNASDAMPEGGNLVIQTANTTLTDQYVAGQLEVEGGDYVLLSVSDTGSGMGEEVKAHIFEPFFTTKDVGKGTGLGLATVFGIVKQSHGHIWVESEAGQGTTFTIYLPRVVEPEQQKVVCPYPANKMPRGDETILLVEDNDVVCELTCQVLQGQGYTVLKTSNAHRAISVAAHHSGPIHLLLTDVVMPNMNGDALAQELRQIRPTLKVLFMSGYTENVIAHRGALKPGIAFLQKPFNPVVLARKVRTVLDG
jgi:PAS domain S-box-containing protein